MRFSDFERCYSFAASQYPNVQRGCCYDAVRMISSHVVTERSVSSFVLGITEMFIKSQTSLSFCFSDVVGTLTQHAFHFVNNVFRSARAPQTGFASVTDLATWRLWRWVQCRADKDVWNTFPFLPCDFDGEAWGADFSVNFTGEIVIVIEHWYAYHPINQLFQPSKQREQLPQISWRAESWNLSTSIHTRVSLCHPIYPESISHQPPLRPIGWWIPLHHQRGPRVIDPYRHSPISERTPAR